MRKNTRLSPAGYTVLDDPEKRIIEEDTLQCVHCGMHWQVKPGSGNVRGFCGGCNGPICGAKCLECVPIERGLENMEAGRLEKVGDGRVSVAVSKIWTPG